jgi:uncharacterized membrane protein YgaE (UPF0421/DUF939 family)
MKQPLNQNKMKEYFLAIMAMILVVCIGVTVWYYIWTFTGIYGVIAFIAIIWGVTIYIKNQA